MTRAGGLWATVTSARNLLDAALAAAAGKRKRPDVAAFLLNVEPEILRLRRELFGGVYQPGPYREFLVADPKPRRISAAPFRDRVVHHALTRVLEPIFERRFSAHSFACRKGMGVHQALALAARSVRRFPYVLKCDVRKYFASIDHEILLGQIARVVKCPPTLGLINQIVASYTNEDAAALGYFSGDTLFTPFERRRGLPLGNQTSQFFANVYLNSLDNRIEQQLQPGAYVRYVDDFLLLSGEKTELTAMQQQVSSWLAEVRLRLHAGKSRIYRSCDGVTFLGWRIFPQTLRLARPNVVEFRRRLLEIQAGYQAGSIAWEKVEARVKAWIAHASHGDTYRLREQIFSEFAFSEPKPEPLGSAPVRGSSR